MPEGFAHGFAVLSEAAEVEYKCSAFYDPRDEIAIRYDEPAIGVAWPVDAPLLSPRDAAAPMLGDVLSRLPRHDPAGGSGSALPAAGPLPPRSG